MRTSIAIGTAAPGLRPPQTLTTQRCFECSDLGFILDKGIDRNCWRLHYPGHNPANAAAVMLRRAVEYLRVRKLAVDPQAFEIAKLLARHTTEQPFDKTGLLETHYTLPLRSFMGVIEDLRKIWLLPIGGRKYQPTGYWIITDADDFKTWADEYRRSPITQLSTLHRVAKRNFPILAEQMELEFWNDL